MFFTDNQIKEIASLDYHWSYIDEDIAYPDKVTYIDVSLIKECPQCHIPFNGKVQIKKEF